MRPWNGRSPIKLSAAALVAAVAGLTIWGLGWGGVALAVPQAHGVQLSAASVEVFGLLEAAVRAEAAFDNPYDPDEIEVYALFESPSGRRLQVPGFYYVEHLRVPHSGRSLPAPQKEPDWRVRFTPDEPGTWRFELFIRDKTGEASSGPYAFEAAPSERRGFVRLGREPGALAFDDGTPFFAVGQNLAWQQTEPADYDRWLRALAEAGANHIRVWMASWSFAIEWSDTGLGVYHARQDRAHQLDHIMKAAEELGIYVTLVLNNHGQLSARTNPEWNANPYNRANGGMLDEPAEFFTSAEAKDLFRRRLRYIVARWGHHTNLLAWELWNEVDLTDGYDPEAVAAWHEEMARFLREIDVYAHLRTTSFSNPQREPLIWRSPEIDITVSHYYNVPDMVQAVLSHDRAKLERYGKPTLTAEFGTDWRGPSADRAGVNIHNAVWAGLFSGAAGTPMSWWWESYIHPNRLYDRYRSVTAFIDPADWLRVPPVDVDAETSQRADLLIPATLEWAGRPDSVYWRIDQQGRLAEAPAAVASFLYGRRYNAHLRADPSVFEIDSATDALFRVQVDTVSASGGILQIRVDGAVAAEAAFPGEGADRQVLEKVEVLLPAGVRRVEVENVGADWLRIGGYELAGAAPRLRALARSDGSRSLVWLQDREHIWPRVVDGYEPPLIEDAAVMLPSVSAGLHEVVWWDPWSMEIAARERVTGDGGPLRLLAPPFRRDIAARVEAAQP